jgi:hypothetical protein
VPTQVADFTIMRFDSSIMSDLVLVEHYSGALISDEHRTVVDFEGRWGLIQQGIDPKKDPRKLIQQRLEQLPG